MRYFFIVIFWVHSIHGVLITLDIFKDTTGKLIYLFGDHHARDADLDYNQFITFAKVLADKDERQNESMVLFVEQPCSLYNGALYPKVTACALPFIASHTFTSVLGQDIELRGTAVAADFLLNQTLEGLVKIGEDTPFFVNKQSIGLQSLTFTAIEELYQSFAKQARENHKKLFKSKAAQEFFNFSLTFAQQGKQEFIGELKKWGFTRETKILEASQILFKANESTDDARRVVIQYLHDSIDPLFRLIILHKIYNEKAQKIVVITGYSHSAMLSYFLKKLGCRLLATHGSSQEEKNPAELEEQSFRELLR